MTKALDWESIERDVRAGILSLREISKKHSDDRVTVSHVAIAMRAKKEGWDRDLQPRIRERSESKLARKIKPGLDAATEREVIEANAERIAQVRGEHRVDISRARTLCLKLLTELEAQSDDSELFRRLGEIMANPDDYGRDKLSDVFNKVLSFPSRMDSMKKAAETLKSLIALEREAYGIDKIVDKPPEPENGVDLTEVARRLEFVLASADHNSQSSQPNLPQVH